MHMHWCGVGNACMRVMWCLDSKAHALFKFRSAASQQHACLVRLAPAAFSLRHIQPHPKLPQAFDRAQLVLYGQQFMQSKQTASILPQEPPATLAGAAGLAAATAPALGGGSGRGRLCLCHAVH